MISCSSYSNINIQEVCSILLNCVLLGIKLTHSLQTFLICAP